MTYHNNRNGLLVKIDTTRFIFPDICPVCGDRAVDRGLIARSLQNKHYSSKQYYPRYSHRRGTKRTRTTEIRRLKIPVCNKHFFSIDEMSRVRAILTLLGGISVAISLIIGVSIGFLMYDHLSIPFHVLTALIGSLSVMMLSLYGLGPSKLDRAVKIVDFDNSDQTIVLQIRNRWYVDEIIRVNPSATQVVRYTMKPRF